MPIQLDELTTNIMVQSAIQNSQSAAQGMTFLMERTRLGHLEGIAQISTREATAMQELRTSNQSREILQAQSALGAPRDTVAVVPAAAAVQKV